MSWRNAWKQLFANVLKIWPEEASITRSSRFSFLLQQPACFAAPDKGVNCPQNTSGSQQSFCVSSVTIKISFSNPTQLFSPPLKKKNTRKLFWCKKERPAGTRINGDKETWRLALFSTLWSLSISGYGQTLWSLCGEDGEPNKRGHSLASDLFSYEARLDFWRRATSCPRQFPGCSGAAAFSQLRGWDNAVALGFCLEALLNELFRITGYNSI